MVLEYRLDPLSGQVIIMANERSARPLILRGEKVTCPFDKGVESLTPPTKLTLPSRKKWQVRAFDNAFAFLKKRGKFLPRKPDALFWNSPAYGEHEVIVETDEHGALFHEFSQDRLLLVFEGYRRRFEALSRGKSAKFVYLFKNHGIKAGASIEHEHSQIVSLPFIPDEAAREIEISRKARECVICMLLGRERQNILSSNASFDAFCPSFSRFPFETRIVAKEHVAGFADFSPAMACDFMSILRESIARVYTLVKDYNVVFHNSPRGEDLHFHANIYPRTNVWAGMELGTGVLVNTRTEKEAIEALRKAMV
ncbi:hypothetical protein HY995_00420 [Candidatus Micrarchaeota archaeon]|nr:hypothetical protein [Candidatus Micrarchaeota archaeon]